MSDNQFPDKNQSEQESRFSSASASDSQSTYNQPGIIGQPSDLQGSIQITPSESQSVENQPIHITEDTSSAVSSMNKSTSLAGDAGTILETWFNKDLVDEMRSRWNAIQVQFVESPCSAVEQGDALVAEILEKLNQILTDHQSTLNQQWLNNDDITTEELRVTLLNYRSFMIHLLKL